MLLAIYGKWAFAWRYALQPSRSLPAWSCTASICNVLLWTKEKGSDLDSQVCSLISGQPSRFCQKHRSQYLHIFPWSSIASCSVRNKPPVTCTHSPNHTRQKEKTTVFTRTQDNVRPPVSDFNHESHLKRQFIVQNKCLSAFTHCTQPKMVADNLAESTSVHNEAKTLHCVRVCVCVCRGGDWSVTCFLVKIMNFLNHSSNYTYHLL